MLGLAAGHMSYYYPMLPEKVASHFGFNGVADGWMTKAEFAGFYLGMIAFLVFLFLGIVAMIKRLPTEMINLPNKEYWLAPARREQTLTRFGNQMIWFTVVMCGFLISIMHLTFLANLDGSQKLNNGVFLTLFIGFMIFVKIWVIQLLSGYSLPKR
jgi:uncharacterized membrane protein